MPRPYPVELRERAVEASHRDGLERAAFTFNIGPATLKRWRRLKREHKTLEPRPMGGDRRGGKRTAEHLEQAVAEKPDRILREFAAWFVERLGRVLSLSGIGRALRRVGFRRRRKVVLASERSSARVLTLRKEYLAKVAGIDPSRLVFIDESGLQRGMQRTLAWRRRGSAVIGRAVRNRGTVTTILGAMSSRGLVAAMYGEGATTTEVFLSFVTKVLAPELRPGDVVVLDNLGAHQPEVVHEAIRAAGATILFLPPYSPELNPIEHAWAKLKTLVRGMTPQLLRELHAAIEGGVAAITAEDAQGWFRHCGYPV
jgi:transposase/transposase-like protein